MATFGKTTIGASQTSSAAGSLRVCKFTLPEAGSVSKLTAYVGGNTNAIARAVIYGDSSGPAAKKALSDEVNYQTGVTAWVDYVLPTPVDLVAADYWLGLYFADSFLNYLYDTPVAILHFLNGQTYPTAPDPFGAPTGNVPREMSIYATYTPIVSATPTIRRMTSRGTSW